VTGATVRRSVQVPGDIPLLVLSFDGYEDIWRPFFSFFWQSWPDCPFAVHLATNVKSYDDARVTSVRVGADASWAIGLRRALTMLDAEYVLLVLDDFLFYEPVNTAEVVRLARVAIEERVACLRLAPNPPPSTVVEGHSDLGWILPDDPYRVTTQVAFWHVDTLLELLRPEYSAWDFEFHASVYGPVPARPMWACWRPAIVYRDCISRGKWMPWGIATCRKAGVVIDVAARQRLPRTGAFLLNHYYGQLRGLVFRHLPRSVQRRRWRRIVDRAMADRPR
jgi:hypothetical protein